MTTLKDTYVYKKEVDWSALNLGINIPVSIQFAFKNLVNQSLKKGDTLNIKIIIDGISFDAKLRNIQFDENKYPTHNELIQIRYSLSPLISFVLKTPK